MIYCIIDLKQLVFRCKTQSHAFTHNQMFSRNLCCIIIHHSSSHTILFSIYPRGFSRALIRGFPHTFSADQKCNFAISLSLVYILSLRRTLLSLTLRALSFSYISWCIFLVENSPSNTQKKKQKLTHTHTHLIWFLPSRRLIDDLFVRFGVHLTLIGVRV